MRRLDEEQSKLVENNMGLVYFVLKKAGIYKSRNDYEDLFGAGCFGLCKAASVWRSDGSPFSTFAYHLIRHEVIAAVKRSDKDMHRLKPLDELSEQMAVPDSALEAKEARMLLTDFLSQSEQLLGQPDATIVRLAAGGRDCQQIADTLLVNLAVVYKAKKRARTVINSWLHKGE